MKFKNILTMLKKEKDYVIKGIVRSQSGNPLAGFKIVALDKDLLGADNLGQATTDANGYFEIRYDDSKFKHFWELVEKGPDVYLKVLNPEGQAVHFEENALRRNAGKLENYTIVIQEESLNQPQIQLERKQFLDIVSKNPNYFGALGNDNSLQTIVSSKHENTYYEELACTGLQPSENQLEAIFEIKRPLGFGGKRCTDGSVEWVTFWIDYQDGNGWIQAGAPVSVNVHDLESAKEPGIWYGVKTGFAPAVPPLPCNTPQVVRLRAILSWQIPHFNPNTSPAWGNHKDSWVVLKQKHQNNQLISLNLGLLGAASQMSEMTALNSLQQFKLLQTSIGEMLEKAEKENENVEGHRKNVKHLLAKNLNYFGSICPEQNPKAIQSGLLKLQPAFLNDFLNNNPNPDLNPVLIQQANTKYEEVTCLGLQPESDLLEATIAIKLPSGYQTDYCGIGSTEYLAYYIDYGTGWEFVATDKFQVHNIKNESHDPKKPLMYASSVFVKDMRKRAASCSKEQVIRAKVVLSWEIDPTPFGANFPIIWGNSLVRRIEVKPRAVGNAIPKINEISDVDVLSINAAGFAQTGPEGHVNAFGNDLGIWGDVQGGGSTHYRLQYRASGVGNWQNSTASRAAQLAGTSITIHRNPSAGGWFSIGLYEVDLAEYSSTMLARFESRGLNGEYELRLQVGDGFSVFDSSAPVTVMIDNIAPSAYPFAGEHIPNEGVTVKDVNGNFNPCGLFTGNDQINVWGNFYDLHYRSYSLDLTGGTIAGWQNLSPGNAVGPFGTMPSGAVSSGQNLFNFVMPSVIPNAIKCAYAIRVRIFDHVIVGYGNRYAFQASAHLTERVTTFDWEP